MRRALTWGALSVAGVLAVGLLALAALPWLLDTPRIQAYIAHAAGQALGRPVGFASVSVSAFPLPAVRIRGLSVADDPRFGTGALLTVEDGRVGIKLRPLLLGRVELGDVALDGVRLSLVDDAGQWNLAALGTAPGPRTASRSGGAAPASGGASGAGAAGAVRVHVANGVVHFRRGGGTAALALEAVQLHIAPGPRADTLAITGRAETRPGAVRLELIDGALTLPPSRQLADAAVQASIRVEAPDVRPLAAAVLESTEVSGALDGMLALRGTLGRLAGGGELRASRLVLAHTRPRCGAPLRRELTLEQLRLPLAFAPASVELAPAQARSGGGTLSLRLAIRLSPALLAIASDIAVTALPLKPILADYACQPYAVSGPLDLTGEASLAPADPWRTLTAQGRFRVRRGQLLGSSLLNLLEQATALERRARTALLPDAVPGAAGGPSAARTRAAAFDAISGSYRIDAGLVSSSDLEYESGGLRATAAGTYRIEDGWIDASVTLARGPSRVRARVSGAPGTVAIAPIGVMRGQASLPARLDRTVR